MSTEDKAMSEATQQSATNESLSPQGEAVCDSQVICRIEQFYYREARTLDSRQFQQWIGLLTEDVDYRMPSRFIATPNPRERGSEAFHAIENELERGGPDNAPLRMENIFTLAIRADRAFKVNAWADNPPARTRRFINNVEVYQTSEGYQVYSNFLMTYSRHDNSNHQYSGQRIDLLREVDGELKIARREVIHDWNVIPVPTLGLFF